MIEYIDNIIAEFAEFMWSKGIQVNINNRRNDIYDMFGGLQEDLKNLEKADCDVILIPMHNDLTDNDVSRIVENIKIFDQQ